MSLINSDGSLNVPTKLDLVNMCLTSIGESNLPAGSLLDQAPEGTDVADASKIVDEVTVEVLNMSWWFNTEHDYKFIPDGDKFIAIPTNLLKVDFGTTINRGTIIRKEGRLYDLSTQSFQFDEPVYGSVTWLTKWEYIPYSAFQYIGLRAARKFQQRIIGSGDLFDFTLVDENDAYVSLQREQAQIQDYNLLDSRILNRFTNPTWTNQK